MGTSGLWLVKFETEQTCLRAAESLCVYTLCLLGALTNQNCGQEKTRCQ